MRAFQGLSNTIVTVDSTTINLVVIGGREVKDPERLHGDRSVRRLVKNCFCVSLNSSKYETIVKLFKCSMQLQIET